MVHSATGAQLWTMIQILSRGPHRDDPLACEPQSLLIVEKVVRIP